MRRFAIWLLPAAFLAAAGEPESPEAGAPPAEAEQAEANRTIVVCPVEGMIDDGVAVLIERAVGEAENAWAFVLDIDTPGGRVDSTIQIVQSLKELDCPTVAYVRGMGAISAGAIISYACDTIVMEPGTNIGTSAPVFMTSEGMEMAGEKQVSYLRGLMQSLAEEHGHNADVGRAMVDVDIELRRYEDGNGETVIYAVDAYASSPPSEAPPSRRQPPGPGNLPEQIRRLLPMEVEEPEVPEPASIESETPEPEPPPENGPRGEVVLAQGKLLNLSTQRALEWGVIPFAAASLEEALEQLGYEDFAIQRLEMTWQEKIFKFLTNPTVAGLLLMVGLGGIYLELKTPGLGAPGAIGVAALALFFGARAVLGLTDWIDMALVIIGCGLILAEVFLTPGFGILGGAGILCLIAGVILSFTFNDFTVPQYSWEWQRLEEAVHALAVTVIGLGILALLTWRYLPRTSLFNRLVLATAQEEDQGYVVQTEEQESAVGLVGRAVSDLRPVGRGRFQGRTYPVMSRAQYIEKGAPIKIIRVEGNRYLVDEAPEEEREEAPQ